MTLRGYVTWTADDLLADPVMLATLLDVIEEADWQKANPGAERVDWME